MADWCPIRCDLARTPEFRLILDRIGEAALGGTGRHAENALVGALHAVWAYTFREGEPESNDRTADVIVRRLTGPMLDSLAGVAGLAEAMEAIDWMAFDDDGARAVRFCKWARPLRTAEAHRARAARSRARRGKRDSPEDDAHAGAHGAHAGAQSAHRAHTQQDTTRDEITPPQPPAGAGGAVVVDSEPAAGEGSRKLAELGVRDPKALAAADRADPETLAWVLAEAPSKRTPAGWAREAVLRGYDPPEGWAAEREAGRKRERRETERAERWEAFRAMTPAQRAEVAAHAPQGHFIAQSLAEAPPERPTESQAIAVALAVGAWREAGGPAP